ncbi:MAG: methionyl-tRNA formyltransferase, partial [Erysipelotrichaceae bacterium]|nr:methionyl-tRNA formyltransferase [Erysipelotrichaceae bacterium]
MNKVRTIFMGTPVFACSILNQLYEEERVELVAVISQPDRPTGRKKLLTPTPVKEIADLHGTPVLQPEKLSQIYEEIVAYNPELIITCAYGQMVSDKILAIPRLGCINVHASLLPKLRGGAPIHKAILFGEKETGITIMEMVHKMDAGDMIAKAGMPIDENMNMGQLHDALMEIGAELLHETLPSIL